MKLAWTFGQDAGCRGRDRVEPETCAESRSSDLMQRQKIV